MKNLIAIAVLMTAASIAWGQDAATCTTLYAHGDRDVILCHVTADGRTTYTKHETADHATAGTVISEVTYRQMMAADAADLQAHTAQLKTVQDKATADAAEAHHTTAMSALKITSKKQCTAAGYDWAHGVCTVKGDK